MKYSGTQFSPAKRKGFSIAPLKNSPLHVVEIPDADTDAVKPFDLFRRADGLVIAQDVLNRKQLLSKLTRYRLLQRDVNLITPGA